MAEYVLNRDLGATDEVGFSRFLRALFSEGVINIRTVTSWKVTQRGAGANMSVDIAAGDGFINKDTFLHVAFSDATKNVTVTAADATNPRIDTVVVYIDRSVQNNSPSNNPNALKFKVVTGTAAGSPTAPNAAAIQASVGAGNPYLVLANLAVAALASNIVNANITDTRVTLAFGGKLYGGASNTQGHTIPNAADDTVALLAATQTLLNKTLTSPILTSPAISGTPTITGWDGWQALSVAPNSCTYNGNGSYDIVYPGDITSLIGSGDRLRTTRGTLAPNQSALLDGSTQSFSKSSPAGMTWTDDFAAGVWIKPTAYQACTLLSRYNGTSGWSMTMLSDGRIRLNGFNGSSSNVSLVQSFQSPQLNKWSHVGAQLDMSAFTATTTTSYIMLNGVDIPASVARGGTNPTTLVQAGNYEIGSENGGTNPFPGKIAQPFVTSAKVTQANMRTIYSQGITSADVTALSIASAHSLSNSLSDINTTNANNLTANGGATTTNADAPFGGQDDGTISTIYDYCIVQKKVFSTNTTVTVQVPEGCTLPTTSSGISAISYSGAKHPHGMPIQEDKWTLSTVQIASLSLGGSTTTWYSGAGTTSGSFALLMPVGEWKGGYEVSAYSDQAGTVAIDHTVTLSTVFTTPTDLSWYTYAKGGNGSGLSYLASQHVRKGNLSISSATPYYILCTTNGGISNHQLNFGSLSKISFVNAYL